MTPDIEPILIKQMMNLDFCFFGLTTTEFEKISFELAESF